MWGLCTGREKKTDTKPYSSKNMQCSPKLWNLTEALPFRAEMSWSPSVITVGRQRAAPWGESGCRCRIADIWRVFGIFFSIFVYFCIFLQPCVFNSRASSLFALQSDISDSGWRGSESAGVFYGIPAVNVARWRACSVSPFFGVDIFSVPAILILP